MARQAVACLREALAGGGGGVARTWARSCRPHGRGQGSGRRLGWEERRPHLPHGEEGHLRVRRRTRDLHLWGGRRRAAGFLHLWGVDLSRLDVGQRPSVHRPRTFDDVEAPGAVDVGLRPGLFLPRRAVFSKHEKEESDRSSRRRRGGWSTRILEPMRGGVWKPRGSNVYTPEMAGEIWITTACAVMSRQRISDITA